MNPKIMKINLSPSIQVIAVLLFYAIILVSCSKKDEDENYIYDDMLLFEEDFSDNSFDWPVGDFGYANMQIKDGKYIIESKVNDPDSLFYVYLFQKFVGNYSVKFTVAQLEGENSLMYGIQWFRKDAYNLYNFLLFSDMYTITYVFNYKVHLITGWTQSESILKNGQDNTIEIINSGNHLDFYINGDLVNQYDTEIMVGDKIGIQASGLGKFAIDHIKVYR